MAATFVFICAIFLFSVNYLDDISQNFGPSLKSSNPGHDVYLHTLPAAVEHCLHRQCNDSTLPYTTDYCLYTPTVCCCLCQLDSILLWSRPTNCTKPFKPRAHRSLLTTLVTLLLLSGDIELNPGPHSIDTLKLGSLNIRSITRKSALIHDIINDQNLDILALQETWVKSTTPPAIKLDIAPPGFDVQHIIHPLVPGGPTRGGGLP